ncbi:hypothetical protein [Winogradskyella thalassocola]|uniref:Uncharacterized protein n=1 Tax=Winogradskyella thalassocola TaxID=262004 RepID=A0A1G8IX14_9FLAO|nr:hypothetical protein [Winogradskyella thalassocola]SDI23534.1 hypothetical protein SAMN04489796_108108 [Winogradskyella thalassocola]
MVKLNTVVIVIFMFIILIPDTILGQEYIKSNATAKIGFRTVHLISLKNIENDVEIATIADDFNKVVAELGYENISYNFWKETEGQEGQFKYIFESNWPDQETFDKVHEYKEFQLVWEKNYDKWKSLVKEDIYNRYTLLN